VSNRKSTPRRRPRKATLKPPFDQLIPAELRAADDVRIRGIKTDGGSVSAVSFDLEVPAVLTARVSTEAEGGYSAEIPALPGCITEGETLDELRENLRDATRAWLEATTGLTDDGPFGEATGAAGRP
jgi:predicted RNase H-like HicB family nuclease